MTRLDFPAVDRAWFKRHPRRNFYIRRILPGELSDVAAGEFDVQVSIAGADGPIVREFTPGEDLGELRAAAQQRANLCTHVAVARTTPTDRRYFSIPKAFHSYRGWAEADALLVWLTGVLPCPWPDSEPPRAPIVPMPEGKR